ncbi:MAG TPA: aminoglycoside phosphotransferase family protein [Casimicrobiaceae bacterium]
MPTALEADGETSAAAAEWLPASLRRMQIVGAHTRFAYAPLAGGVSSDIYRVDLPAATICVKRALRKLKVAADWRAPPARNRSEVAWMRTAGAIVPGAVPEILGDDPDAEAFAMSYLPPSRYPVWKEQLRDGAIGVDVAAAVGDVLGHIHAATATAPDVAKRFANEAIFDAIRLEPYLGATGRAHTDLLDRFAALADATRANRHVLIHGDFSPKNILLGPKGPVILDAECATFGDPAFDLAFVENHLLLKGAWQPQWRARYIDALIALQNAYLAHVIWEPPATVLARTAALLPGLMLARIDGKSPVEYLTDDVVKNDVRAFARELLTAPVADPALIAQRWGACPTP